MLACVYIQTSECKVPVPPPTLANHPKPMRYPRSMLYPRQRPSPCRPQLARGPDARQAILETQPKFQPAHDHTTLFTPSQPTGSGQPNKHSTHSTRPSSSRPTFARSAEPRSKHERTSHSQPKALSPLRAPDHRRFRFTSPRLAFHFDFHERLHFRIPRAQRPLLFTVHLARAPIRSLFRIDLRLAETRRRHFGLPIRTRSPVIGHKSPFAPSPHTTDHPLPLPRCFVSWLFCVVLTLWARQDRYAIKWSGCDWTNGVKTPGPLTDPASQPA